MRRRAQVRLATINALGDSHTRPGGNKAGRGWLQSAKRTLLLTKVIRKRDFDLVGLQEFQGVQQKVWRGLNPGWRIHGKKDNAVVWLQSKFHPVDFGHLDVPYFGGKEKPMPWVVLRDRKTGQLLAFLSTHNPANVRGPAERHRVEGWQREADWAKDQLKRGVAAAIVVGDKNAGPKVYKPFIEKRGGKVAGIPGDLPNSPGRGIDWIAGWGDVEFTKHKTSKTRRIARMSDHPVVQAVAHI
jgi:endonuclease/exonuclease/phosphatase family metal-dependent hydrolase